MAKDFRIIETPALWPDVLLYRDLIEKDEDYVDVVIIQAYGQTPDEPDAIKFFQIYFMDVEMCQYYIRDFSVQTAVDFCRERDLFYEHTNHKLED